MQRKSPIDCQDENANFSNQLFEHAKPRRRPKATTVLMISWTGGTGNLNTSEVDELKEVFEKTFHFTVVVEYIGNDRSPQLYAYKIISNFIFYHDSNSSNLIIYYAGHGFRGEAGLTHKQNHTSTEEWKRHDAIDCDAIDWDAANGVIEHANAHVTLIFDYRSNDYITKTGNFEFLGACQLNSVKARPSPTSFTKALVWALKDLINTNRSFTVPELQRKITEAPNFPNDQYPFYCERAIPRTLAACSDNDFAAPPTEGVSVNERYLDLRFYFTSDIKPVVSELMAFITRSKATVCCIEPDRSQMQLCSSENL